MLRTMLTAIVCGGCGLSLAWAADWPQWRGPARTMLQTETGLLKAWPKDGPRLLWTTEKLGGGYSTPSVAKGKIYGMSYRGADEVIWALEEATGKEIWVHKVGPQGKAGYNEGPRSTPTVDGDRVYGLGVGGELACVNAGTGTPIWSKNFKKEFDGKVGGWGYSESVLIDGDVLICTPGSKKATIAALNKTTGAVLWTGVSPEQDGAEYASAIVAESAGQKMYIQFVKKGVVAFDAQAGKFLWRYDRPANGTANCSTPLFHDNMVFAASAYGNGGGMARVTKSGDGWKAEQVYDTKKMKNHHGGMILLDGYIYGSDDGLLACMDFKTGDVKWSERTGKGSVAFADGRLYYRQEDGKMYLVEATPTKYIEHGRFEPSHRSKHKAWPHPVIANGRLYLRDQDVLLCYDVRAAQ
jgi:outer membrane protein assembly factor BamB